MTLNNGLDKDARKKRPRTSQPGRWAVSWLINEKKYEK
jgi:hypothetical protein